MARIAVDMDEVIADFNAKFITTFNAHFDERLTLDDLRGKSFLHCRPELQQGIMQMLSENDFFADLPVIPDSQEILSRMCERHEIYIATAAMEFPPCFNAKFSWLRKNFPFISPANIVFCGSKSIINADYLIDDNSHHFSTFGGEGLLFSAPHNIYEQGFRRVKNWQEVGTLFL